MSCSPHGWSGLKLTLLTQRERRPWSLNGCIVGTQKVPGKVKGCCRLHFDLWRVSLPGTTVWPWSKHVGFNFILLQLSPLYRGGSDFYRISFGGVRGRISDLILLATRIFLYISTPRLCIPFSEPALFFLTTSSAIQYVPPAPDV